MAVVSSVTSIEGSRTIRPRRRTLPALIARRASAREATPSLDSARSSLAVPATGSREYQLSWSVVCRRCFVGRLESEARRDTSYEPRPTDHGEVLTFLPGQSSNDLHPYVHRGRYAGLWQSGRPSIFFRVRLGS